MIMACYKRFLSVQGLLTVATLTLLALLLCCTSCNKKELLNKEHPSNGDYLVDAEIVLVNKDGEVLSKTLLRSDASSLRATPETSKESEKGKITGLGFFESGKSTVIRVTANSGYKYKGMYFRYTTGYDTSSFPKTSSTLLSAPTKSVTVKGNLTVVAVFEKDDGVEVIIE